MTVSDIVVTMPPTPPKVVVEPLVFSWTAWSKLLAMLNFGDTEVGGFGITRKTDPLYVEEFQLLPQVSSVASVEFFEGDIQKFTWDMIDRNLDPENYFRVWIHTHPGQSPTPSGTDEETWRKVMGQAPWAVMFILAKGGSIYCRHRRGNVETVIPVQVDYSTAPNEWWSEYFDCVDEWDFTTISVEAEEPPPTVPANVNWDTVWLDEDTDELYEAILLKDLFEITEDEWEFVHEYEFLYDKDVDLPDRNYADIWD